MVARIDSPFQLAIYDEVLKGTGHIVVEAGAGTGKTTTEVGCMERLPSSKKIFYTAFNRKIVEDVQAKVAHLPNVLATTTHTAGNRICRTELGVVKPYDYATVGWLDRAINLFEDLNDGGTQESDFLKTDIRKFQLADLIHWVKETNPYFKSEEDFSNEAPEFIKGITKEMNREEIYRLAGEFAYKACTLILKAAQRGGRFNYDYTDMIWLPVRLDLVKGAYDVVIIDEAQDMNVCMLELIIKLVKKGGRIIAVGDTFQAIYAFRGADSEALTRLTKELKAKVFQLPVSYRVPQSGAEFARQYLPEGTSFQAFEGNREGEVREGVSQTEFVKTCKPGEIVMCRINRPLIKLAIKFLTEGRPAYVAGHSIGKGFQKIVKMLEADGGKFKSPSEMKIRLEEWFQNEKELIEKSRLNEKRKMDDIAELEDKYECLMAFADSAPTIEGIKLRMKKLFADPDHHSIDPKKFICLSSIHKAKGLESENTWVLEECFGGTARSTNQREEENLCYVASTRHKNILSFVEGPPSKDCENLDNSSEDGEE